MMNMFPRKLWFSFWVFAEAYSWLIATIIFIVSIMTRGFHFDLVDVVVYYLIISYKQNGFYLLYKPARFLLMPFYFFAYGISLMIARIHAAVTILNDDWGTRDKGKVQGNEQRTYCRINN